MRIYYFFYKRQGSDMQEDGIPADDHEEFYRLLEPWLAERDATLCREKTIISWESEEVPFPPLLVEDDASRYLASLTQEERRPIDPLVQVDDVFPSPESFTDEELEAAGRIFHRG